LVFFVDYSTIFHLVNIGKVCSKVEVLGRKEIIEVYKHANAQNKPTLSSHVVKVEYNISPKIKSFGKFLSALA
jgi:hypothetical protein